MKKMFLSGFALFFITALTHAATIIVTVTNNQFSPANITNVHVGDVIQYNFAVGFHNAISTGITDAIPAGAEPINSGAPSGTNPRTYSYTVTTPGVYKYACQVRANLTAYTGMVGQFTVESALPAVLKDFRIAPVSKGKPVLSWKTVTELNVGYFSVRSSTNGIDFTETAKVPAKGNSTTEQFYNYQDERADGNSRFVYYMLAIVDKDGREAHSDILEFKNSAAAAKIVTELSPNPVMAGGHLMFQFNAEKKGDLRAQVIDMNGKQIIEQKMSAFPGLNNGHLHLGEVPAGTYTIIFSVDGLKESKKVVVK